MIPFVRTVTGAEGVIWLLVHYRPAPAETLRAVAEMDRICATYGIDLATAALQGFIEDPRVNMTVVG